MGITIALILLAMLIFLAMQIDDWSRDLSTNRAATSIDSPDPTLRSLELKASADEIKAAITGFVERAPAWEVNPNPSDDNAALALVRTTRVFRFADDVQVFLQSTATGTRVDVHSQSRVGKGDLGQNPRNIRELLNALRDELR